MSNKESPCLVFDNGSGYIKAGLALEEMEAKIIPSMVGRSIDDPTRIENMTSEAFRRQDHLNISRPITNGIISNFEDYELMLEHIFKKDLSLEPNLFTFLLSRNPDEPIKTTNKTMELLFEKFNIPSFSSVDRALLSMYGVGSTSGVVVDAGYTSTRVSAIINGRNYLHLQKTLDFGGNQLTTLLKENLNNKGIKLEITVADKIKAKICYATNNYQDNLDKLKSGEVKEKSYELPDGRFIKLGEEQFNGVENYFKPYLYGSLCPGLPVIIEEIISKFDYSQRRLLYQNLCLAGGGVLIKNFEKRLIQDVVDISPPSFGVSTPSNISDNKQNLAWLGGSIVCALNTFKSSWIEKRDYEECGASVCIRKVF